ncbi:unnamed protein product [Chrysoparadoxa australica]
MSSASLAPPLLTKATEKVKVGVLLLNLGGPERSEDVEGFLFNLFADPDIIRLPGILTLFQSPIAAFISARRAPKSKAAYESIGGGSPIVKYTKAQAKGIEEGMQRKGIDAKAYVAMRYWHPFTEQALDEMRNDGVNTIVVLPLYPHFSISTSGSSLRVLRNLFAGSEGEKLGSVPHTVVPAWYDRPGYVKAVAGLIKREINKYTHEERTTGEGVHVLFSAHGVPNSYIELGDPYQSHVQKCVELIQAEYEDEEVTSHLSYQSRVGPIEWLKPYTEDIIPQLGLGGVRNLVVVPISFVSEHIETLEEIDMEYRELAEANGVSNWRRVPALNTDPLFLEDLSDLCIEALQEPMVTITEACASNNVDIEEEEQADGINKVTVASAGAMVLDAVFGQGLAHTTLLGQ